MKEKKEKKKGSCFGTFLKILLVIIILFAALIVYMRWSNQQEAKQRESERLASYTESYWPESGIAEMLPKPSLEYGLLNTDSTDWLSVTTGYTSEDDYEAYIDECKEAGYTVGYYQGSELYTADNEEGYSLQLYFDEDDQEMDIHLYAPDEPETEDTEVDEEEETEVAVADTEAPAETEASESVELVDGMRPEFKEAIDSYEAFFDEYCEFMTTYANSDNTVSMLADYMDFLSKYTDYMDKMDALEDDAINDAEAAYYTEANLRITQKLLEVAAATE